jgi:calcineurin-like phosphoesterase family protein
LHLGDVALGHFDQVAAYRKRLQGRICLVLGNHDRTRTSMRTAGFDVVVPGGEICIGSDRWVCRHDPAKITPEMAAGARRVLHGHCHGNSHRGSLPEHLRELAIDCGVDALRSVAPVPWDQVR